MNFSKYNPYSDLSFLTYDYLNWFDEDIDDYWDAPYVLHYHFMRSLMRIN